MTIDERLEKLAERRDALTQTVELMAAEQREARREYEERFARQGERLAQIMEAINSLARIAEAHERRLDDYGDRLDDIERGA